MKKTTKRDLRKKVLRISEGVLSSLTDASLVFLVYGYELFTDPKMARSLSYNLGKMDKRMEEINYDSLKRAIQNIRQKGWIKENLMVTNEGERRMKQIFPEYKKPAKWDGKWYLAIFDIPEDLHYKRDILRENLQNLGFGKLQHSVWVCPFNFLGDIQKIVREQDLSPYVIFTISEQVGQENTKILAERVWNLNKVNREYQKFISDFKGEKDAPFMKVLFRFYSIFQKDPGLPRELLPDDWEGEYANDLYLEIVNSKKKKKNRKGKIE